MKVLFSALFILVFFVSSVAQAERGRKPCSGKMGGISHCTASGKFVCENGKISKSKKTCKFRVKPKPKPKKKDK